jgi:Flp pilus assembly protein TadG
VTRRPSPRRDRGDGGYVTLFALGISVGLVAVIGLVHDAGRALRAQSDAYGGAAAAARAGTQELDPASAAGGRVQVDPDLATAAAHDYLAARGLDGTVIATDDRVTVTVTRHVDFQILPGGTSLDATATARATQERPTP